MFSNFRLRMLTLTLSALLYNSGCGLLGESVANFSSNSGNNISSGAGCLRDSMETLGQYFNGNVEPLQVSGAWDCVDQSLDLFSKKVRGENPGYYKSRELASFIESQVLDPGGKISDSLLVEIMRLKQLMVGGATDRLTIVELQGLREFAGKLKELFVELQPFLKKLSGNWEPANSSRQEVRDQLKKMEPEFAAKITKYWPTLKATYDLGQLQLLADALLNNFPGSPGLTNFRNWIKKYLPVLIASKKILLNSDNKIIATQDWQRLLTTLPNLYCRYVFYTYLLKETPFFWGEALTDFNRLMTDLLANLSKVLTTRGNGSSLAISNLEINGMVDALDSAQLLTDFIGSETLKSIVPVAVSRFLLAPTERLAGKKQIDLGQAALDNFRGEYEAFFSAQQKLNELFNHKSSWSHSELRVAFQGLSGGREELFRVLQSPQALSFDTKNRMYIDPNLELPYTQDSALKLNLMRSFSRIFIRSYAKDLNRATVSSSLTKDEVVNDAFTELRPVLIQSKLIEPDNLRFAKNRFLEANLFTPVGNGDANLDFKEATSIALMIWSGLNLSKEFESQIQTNCKAPGANPDLMSVPCALEVFRTQVPLLATNIPLMAKNLQSMPVVEGGQMLLETLRATGWATNAENTAKPSDLSLVPHLLQYMEIIYRRWDTNKDNTLDKAEALIAEPIFRPLLSEMSGQTNASVLRAGFIYVLIYQQNPADDFFKFLFFMNDEANWNVNVTRPKLSKVLGFIADEIAKP